MEKELELVKACQVAISRIKSEMEKELELVKACQVAISREVAKNYFSGQSRKVVSVHYTDKLNHQVVVTFQPLEDLRFLSVEYLYSSYRELQIFKSIGVLQGLSVVQMPLPYGITAESIASRLAIDYVPANRLEFDPGLVQCASLAIERWNSNWRDIQGTVASYSQKLGLDYNLVKEWCNEANLELHSRSLI